MLLPLLLALTAPITGTAVQATVSARIVRPAVLRGSTLSTDELHVREGATIERRCETGTAMPCRLVIYDLP